MALRAELAVIDYRMAIRKQLAKLLDRKSKYFQVLLNSLFIYNL